MKHLCVLLVVLVMMCWPAICHAGVDENGHYGVLGMGKNSCREWTKGRFNRDETESIDIAWVGGFVTAVNRFGYGSSDISKGTDADGIVSWIDNYCAQHPRDALADAASALTIELQARVGPLRAQ